MFPEAREPVALLKRAQCEYAVLRIEALVPGGELPRSLRSARFDQLQSGPEPLEEVVAIEAVIFATSWAGSSDAGAA
ncbi:MAG TPA: hypothetical protein VIM73_05375 [Polyangiaceae bacterium]